MRQNITHDQLNETIDLMLSAIIPLYYAELHHTKRFRAFLREANTNTSTKELIIAHLNLSVKIQDTLSEKTLAAAKKRTEEEINTLQQQISSMESEVKNLTQHYQQKIEEENITEFKSMRRCKSDQRDVSNPLIQTARSAINTYYIHKESTVFIEGLVQQRLQELNKISEFENSINGLSDEINAKKNFLAKLENNSAKTQFDFFIDTIEALLENSSFDINQLMSAIVLNQDLYLTLLEHANHYHEVMMLFVSHLIKKNEAKKFTEWPIPDYLLLKTNAFTKEYIYFLTPTPHTKKIKQLLQDHQFDKKETQESSATLLSQQGIMPSVTTSTTSEPNTSLKKFTY